VLHLRPCGLWSVQQMQCSVPAVHAESHAGGLTVACSFTSVDTPLNPHLLLPCRLTSLPPNVLWHIARKMGRRCRTVSRALLAAYGPLDCSLVLSGSAALNKLQLLLERSGQRLQHVMSLQLPLQGGPLCSAELLSAVVATLPRLQSLTLRLHNAGLPLLSPLHPSLTALDVIMYPDPGATSAIGEGQVPLLLPNLRSLTLGGTLPTSTDMLAWGFLLSSWQHLERLTWFPLSYCTPELLAMRRGSPQLTSLSLGYMIASPAGWQNGDTAAMQRALGGVRSLSLKAHADDDAAVAAVDAMVAGLSRCSGIQRVAVHLTLDVFSWSPPPDLLQLSSLQLASLELPMRNAASAVQVEPLLHSLHALSRLTKLELSFFDLVYFYLDMPQQLPTSLVELRVGGAWHPSSLLPPLQALPALRVLGLHLQSREWLDEAAEQLSTLTQLRTLSLMSCSLPPGWVTALSCLTALQELRLRDTMEGSATDEDLLQLARLRALTCLSLNEAGQASANGFLDLLDALPTLRQLELARVLKCGVDAEELVEGLLPSVLPRLTHLKLVDEQLPRQLQDALLAAAEAHGCRCDVVVLE
jgi:hypothetical protein